MVGSLVYVADDRGGLLILRCTGQSIRGL
ncbi:MAG: hypothetical protein IPO15_27640 [Anaerolineae bacterium]|nr:hypothetical protein [Anaerolineae bacterium]MBK9234488.1 hypothetical protein [Anaerolineae bacterium]